MEDLFQKGWRMDWGLGNPNITAALIVTLLVAVWALAYLHPKGFWGALPLFAGLGICLIHTLSRGGLLGAFAGLGILLWFAPRPWPKVRWIGVVVAFWLAIVAAVYLQAYERFGQGIAEEDKSITHRLIIWKEVPKMLSDAPGGWGIDKTGEAYMQWYQTPGRDERYGSLVNTHLTKLVELGIVGGIFYLFAWFLAVILAWPDSKHRWRSVPLGILVGFAVVASFTNMAKTPMVWILPGLSVLAVVTERLLRKSVPNLKAMAAAGVAAVLLVCGTYFYGGSRQPSLLTATKKTVIWKSDSPKAWIFVDRQVFGDKYAHVWRKAVGRTEDRGQEGVGFTMEPEVITDSPIRLIISGKASESVLERVKAHPSIPLLLLNPSFEPALLGDLSRRHIEVIAGEFSAAANRTEWRNAGSFTLLPGVGDYLSSWPELVLAFMDKTP